MTEYEAASLAISRAGLTATYIGLAIAAGNMLAAIVAAVGIWVFGAAMHRSNKQRAEANSAARKPRRTGIPSRWKPNSAARKPSATGIPNP